RPDLAKTPAYALTVTGTWWSQTRPPDCKGQTNEFENTLWNTRGRYHRCRNRQLSLPAAGCSCATDPGVARSPCNPAAITVARLGPTRLITTGGRTGGAIPGTLRRNHNRACNPGTTV